MGRVVTPRKMAQMKADLEKLQVEYRKKGKGMSEAAAHGGATVSKIPEYDAVKELLHVLGWRIANLMEEITAAQVIQPQAVVESDRASVLSVIHAVDVSTGDAEKYCFGDVVVLPEHFDGVAITQGSPIGIALIGKRVGETVEIRIPAGMRRLKITEITKITEG